LLCAAAASLGARGQSWEIGGEIRARYENRTGVGFGRSKDYAAALVRTRLSATCKPAPWLKLSGMAQDARAPGYGPGAPSTLRDPVDLQEAYVELFPDAASGFSLSAGRRMLNYGESRLIGSPQWGNLARTWDHVRASYGIPGARFDLVVLSPVKIRIGEFNRVSVSDRIWGAYNSFPGLFRGSDVEAYFLRHRFGALRVNTAGARAEGPLGNGLRYGIEGAVQGDAAAWFSSLTKRWTVAGRSLDISAEYKYASAKFDQMYPANHDKFGHQDLFGWRNIHNVRSLASYSLGKLAVNLMYNSSWLANAREALYSGAGAAIAQAPAGTAGRHVGQEADLFGVYRHGRLEVGAGFGYFFQGRFVRNAAAGARPTYVYLFHTFTL
jgi:hypothetical protein